MADAPLQDRSVQSAVSHLIQRAERQEDLGQLLATFVDPGISVQLDNANHQILYGRRGTGKTHVLKVVQGGADALEAQLGVYIDMRTLGSSQLYEDESRPLFVRVTSLLKDVLKILEDALLERAPVLSGDDQDAALERLDELSKAIARTLLVEEETALESEAASEREAGGGAKIAAGPTPTASIEGKLGGKESSGRKESVSGRPLSSLRFQEVGDALERALDALGLERLWVLLDEWTAIPLDLQPLLAEFLKRALMPRPKIVVKIASLEYRSNFGQELSHNNVLGFELGADISSTLELDDYFVYDRNPAQTASTFGELLYRHVHAELEGIESTDYLADQHGVTDADGFTRRLFASPEAFNELVRAGEGVARDFINIFTSAFFDALKEHRETIGIQNVRNAARDWYEKDKEPNIDPAQRKIMRRIIDEVIGDRSARSFMLEKELESADVLRSLFDQRVIHLVQRGYADKDNPGRRYNIYTLDFGTYVDLIGTKQAPTFDFAAQDEDEEDVVVPFDDKRSIRRIVLRKEHLEADGSDD